MYEYATLRLITIHTKIELIRAAIIKQWLGNEIKNPNLQFELNFTYTPKWTVTIKKSSTLLLYLQS
jgi:hypothetical protein